MPIIEFDKNNKQAPKNDYSFPKLKLKKDEMARIMLVEQAPVFEYVHNLEKPKIIEGEVLYETKQRRDKTEYRVNQTQFLSTPICTGDIGVLQEDGIDPKGCLVCALVKESGGEMTAAPRRKFAMHIMRYRTKGGTTDIIEPFSIELLVWAFGEKVYGAIADIKDEWGDLRTHDLLLGPVVSEQFQNYEVKVSQKAEWLDSTDRKQLVKATYEANKIPDLTIACGSKVEEKWTKQNIQDIKEAWKQVNEIENGTARSTSLDEDLKNLGAPVSTEEVWSDGKTESQAKAEKESAPSSDSLDSLFSDAPAVGDDEVPVKEPVTEEASSDDLDALFGESSDAAAEEAPAEEPKAKSAAKAKAPAAEKPKSDEDELDALLGV